MAKNTERKEKYMLIKSIERTENSMFKNTEQTENYMFIKNTERTENYD